MSLRPGTTVIKDPDASLVYTMDWSAWLGSPASIDTSVWAITGDAGETVPNLTLDNDTVAADNLSTAVRLVGGTLNKTYRVTNAITTNETPDQIDNRSFYVRIQQR